VQTATPWAGRTPPSSIPSAPTAALGHSPTAAWARLAPPRTSASGERARQVPRHLRTCHSPRPSLTGILSRPPLPHNSLRLSGVLQYPLSLTHHGDRKGA
jgi:hypothetical protein